jgi:type II secretion system protein I
MSRAFQNSASGFTLIEVLVALTILSVSLAVLLQVFGTNLDRINESRAETTAAALTQSLLAEAGKTIPLRPGDSNGDFGNGYRWRLRVEPYGNDEDRRAWPTNAIVISASTFWERDTKSVTLKVLRLTPKDTP